MRFATMNDLYTYELEDLLSAELQLIEALPRIAAAAKDPRLKEVLLRHLAETQNHVDRLYQIFMRLGHEPKGVKCEPVRGMIKEGEELLKGDLDADVRDAALIGTARRVGHYEMAGYGSARTYARILKDALTTETLQASLDEDAAADRTLTSLAEQVVQRQVMG